MNISTAKKLATILRDTLAALRSAQVPTVLLTLMALSPLPAMAQNPVPLVYQPTVPTAAAPGGKTFTLTVAGSGFVSGSVINWNGTAQTTTYVSSESLTASIPASAITTASTATITVTSPTPGGGTSNPVYFTVNKSYTTVSLLRNDATAGAPDGIAAGNLSGNGILDLVVANNPTADGTGNDVAVYLGNGNGTFQSPVTYPVGHPGALVLGDFRGNGKLDIAVLQPVAGKVAILLGNGDGTFGSEVGYSTGMNPVALAAADVNGDGHLDLVVVNFNSNTVSVLLGNGDGTFQAHLDYATGVKPVSVAVADFNRDGKLDLAVANNNDNTVSILLNNGSGAFPTQATYATASAPTGLVAADFGNGNMDLALSTASQSASVLLGNGDGTFQPANSNYPIGVNSQAIATADMNSDGFLDLVVANYTDNTLSVMLGNGNGTFKVQSVYPTNLGPGFMAIGDFSDVGKLDVAVVDVTADVVSIMSQSLISISPTPAKFAIEELNTPSAAMQITLKNSTALPYGISGVTIGGTNATDFALGTNTCGTSLAANATCSIAVTFDPQELGTYWWLQPQDRSAELLVNGSTGGSTGAGLAGNGQVGITLGPTRHAIFKTQLINTSSAANTSTFTNDSGVPITFTGQYYNQPSGIVIYGANAGDFLLTTTCPVAPATLAAGASCTASVVYHPTIVGNETATLAFFGTFSPGNGQQAVEFTASSTAVSVAPITLTFPATTVGTSSAAKATVFKNAGSTAMPITSVTIQGADPKDFIVSSNTCSPSVAAGASCKIGVTFTPTATGTRTATLNIGDPDPTGPQIVTLTGTGQ
jgi:hypothetical protein